MATGKAHGSARRIAVGTLVVTALLGGCSDDRAAEKPKATGSHVWRSQTDMLFEARDQAKDVDAQLRAQEAALERARRGD